ncbi:MAG: hypothetical protein GY859_35530, partial [Desulfobacterales bacterium]|nr:hypothetical protein [Desulfobacterales bacterium]
MVEKKDDAQKITNDQNFKNLIVDYTHDALEFFAAAEAKNISPNARVIPVRQEQLKDRLGDHFHELDTPVLVEWPDGTREAILFVLEEDTLPRRFSIHRLARYCLHLAEMFKTNRVVPAVIFLTPGGYPEELRLTGDQGEYLTFRFIV